MVDKKFIDVNLFVGFVVKCSGVKVLILYFYELKGFICSWWNNGN